MIGKIKEKLILYFIRRAVEDFVRSNMDKFKQIGQTVVVAGLLAGAQAAFSYWVSGKHDPAEAAGVFVATAVAYWMKSPKSK